MIDLSRHEYRMEFACELADKLLREMAEDMFQIDEVVNPDEYKYTELVQSVFDSYYDIILNFIEKHEN